ncbi:MAG: discoidin domain-containing protein [Clostridia bacterium]|nr:discoidin domain-containing protein [Clostridia bacterium]
MRLKDLSAPVLFRAGIFALFAVLLAVSASAAYPSSGTDIPEGSALLTGEVIGEMYGWDGSDRTGANAAFDGNESSYYDPTVMGAEYAYCGMDMGQPYILTKVMILPRDSQPGRFNGASIQGSNDMDSWDTLFVSSSGMSSAEWQEIVDFDIVGAYQYYRYWNGREHGDVAEVEFYGRSDGTAVSGPVRLTGEIIGEGSGWGGQRDKGAQAAFDGDRYTYYDPSARSADYAYAGLDLGQPFILSKVRILPRDGWLDRFKGGSIQGSNDLDEWTTVCESTSAASAWDWQVFTDFDDNSGYRYYRYWNGMEHGDVAEVQLYGYPLDGDYTPPTPATMAVPVTEVKVTLSVGRDDVRLAVEPFAVAPGGTYPALPSVSDDAFLGWFTLPEGGAQVKEGDKVTRLSDHMLYGQWKSEEAPAGSAQIPVSDPDAEAADAEIADAENVLPADDSSDAAEEGGLNLVPIVCIAVSLAAFAAAMIVMAKSKED